MDFKRFTGPQAGSQKYDLLTALALAGLNGSPGFQTSMLRLVAIVTARYNWRNDELTVGQREMARLWSVDERTVKREIKRLTKTEILLQLRPGVRGRVAAYRLNYAEVYRLSAPHWENVGPDFSARMEVQQPEPATTGEKVVRVDFGARAADVAAPTPGSGPWSRTLARLAQSDPGLHRSWFSGLVFDDFEQGLLLLKAPSAFAAQYVLTHHLRPLQGMAAQEFHGLRRIEITG
ncbi:hypothetical protein CLG85_009485 [Yangia mangrovi]|uniref:DnaA N-terminal domain-containing protein n=2 Tax=Alloyangia mangrovi TaxID=1779329 RepID=A0A2A3JT07_9RHOB|nr:hypothetical protein [Alloyangia mangrovi]